MEVHMFSSSLFILLFLSASIFSVNFTFASGQCLQDQKQLLVELKNNLTYDASVSTKLVKWDESTDCCKWPGVKCDSKSRVYGLDLNSESISGGINDALFRLVSLRSLNLAYNTLDSVQMPLGFGKLTHLSYLNLSNSGFSGQIPFDLSNLTGLVVLDLSSQYSSPYLENPDLSSLIRNFVKLRELYLDGVNVSANGFNWCNAISSSLPNLRVLSMSNAYLTGPFDASLLKLQYLSIIRLDGNAFSTPIPDFFAGFSNLRVLTMSSCDISGVTPGKLFQIPSLETIDLGNNRDLHGSFLEFPLNGSLKDIELGYTQFSGSLPESIGNLRMLSNVDLRNCNFSGPIPRSIKNLTHLSSLNLAVNQFNGSVPSFAFLKNINSINLERNGLTGQIPDSLWEGLESLTYLSLNDNSLEGEIPMSLFLLPSLGILSLSNNRFHGSIRELKTGFLPPLESLELGMNSLEGPIPRFFFELKNLSNLKLASNKFNGSVGLSDFRKLTDLASLDLSYNNLSVHVSRNVSVSSLFPRLGSLMLASCKLQNLPLLDNDTSLMMLDLSKNQIHGEIPNWIWAGFLRFLNLSSNQFTTLQEPYDLRRLEFLDLHNNLLSGPIPIPPPSAGFIDFSNNNFSSSIHAEGRNFFTRLSFFSIANNKVNGTIPVSFCNTNRLQVLDLSNNSLHGNIPSCLNQTSLTVLNLRRNNLSGNIPNTFPIGCDLESLDLSFNVLRGGVPLSLGKCTEMEVLNLGNNELSGEFPCWLKNLTKLHVIVLRSNKFLGNISCLDSFSLSELQIIDVGCNNFNGLLPANLFRNLKGMVVDKADHLDHLSFNSIASNVYYQYSVTVTAKGMDIELGKILTIFTSLDFSNNHFEGFIPETIGDLRSLYALNLSENALSGQILGSLGNLQSLESLDLSFNNLGPKIPEEIAKLTFLSFLNLSHNRLVGRVPTGNQMHTFLASSYIGNEGLCGFPLSKSCSDENTPAYTQHKTGDGKMFDAEIYVSGALGFFVGVIFIFGPILFCKRWRRCYNKNLNEFISLVLHQQGHRAKNEDW